MYQYSGVGVCVILDGEQERSSERCLELQLAGPRQLVLHSLCYSKLKCLSLSLSLYTHTHARMHTQRFCSQLNCRIRRLVEEEVEGGGGRMFQLKMMNLRAREPERNCVKLMNDTIHMTIT